MRNSRYKRRKYIRNGIIAFLFVVTFSLTIYFSFHHRQLTIVEGAIRDAFSVTIDFLAKPVNYVKGKIDVFNAKEDVYQKYEKAKEKLEGVSQKDATIDELAKENEQLRELLKIDSSLSDYEKINATIVSRDVGKWFDRIVIDKGTKDGLENDMAVVINDGLIGYITDASYFSSNVQLLTAKNYHNRISVKIALNNDQYANGILSSYDEKKGVYIIEGISYAGNIDVNAYVTTTGLSDRFPSGILIGYVKNVTTDNFDLGKIVEVTPSVNFDEIKYVSVLKRKALKP